MLFNPDRLAQLVERYIDIVEVTSSSLVPVTNDEFKSIPSPRPN